MIAGRRSARRCVAREARVGHLVKIEVEVDDSEQLERGDRRPASTSCCSTTCDLDATARGGRRRSRGRVLTEASGGIDPAPLAPSPRPASTCSRSAGSPTARRRSTSRSTSSAEPSLLEVSQCRELVEQLAVARRRRRLATRALAPGRDPPHRVGGGETGVEELEPRAAREVVGDREAEGDEDGGREIVDVESSAGARPRRRADRRRRGCRACAGRGCR